MLSSAEQWLVLKSRTSIHTLERETHIHILPTRWSPSLKLEPYGQLGHDRNKNRVHWYLFLQDISRETVLDWFFWGAEKRQEIGNSLYRQQSGPRLWEARRHPITWSFREFWFETRLKLHQKVTDLWLSVFIRLNPLFLFLSRLIDTETQGLDLPAPSATFIAGFHYQICHVFCFRRSISWPEDGLLGLFSIPRGLERFPRTISSKDSLGSKLQSKFEFIFSRPPT